MLRPSNPFRSSAQKQVTRDMDTYLPPNIEQAVTAHLQGSMPANLKKYQDSGAYVPQHAADAMQKHLQDTLPSHMKQYAGAYMQQRVIRPGMVVHSGNDPVGSSQETSRPSGPSGSSGPPRTVMPTAPLSARPGQDAAAAEPPGGPALSPTVPGPGPQEQQEQSRDASYSFITNPGVPPKRSPMEMLPGGGSIITRVGLVVGVIIILVIGVSIFKSILGSGNKTVTAALVNVVQDQQEILNVTKKTPLQQSLSSRNQNFAANIQISLGSSQSQLRSYMATNHIKLKASQLSLKISKATNDQLSASAASGTYNDTFSQIMKTKLSDYGTDIQKAYRLEKGKKGRALLNDSYKQISLFETQLSGPN